MTDTDRPTVPPIPADPRRRAAGRNRSVKLILAGRAETVFLASDADSRLREQIAQLCAEHNTALCTAYTGRQIGDACGLDVGCAVLTQITDNN